MAPNRLNARLPRGSRPTCQVFSEPPWKPTATLAAVSPGGADRYTDPLTDPGTTSHSEHADDTLQIQFTANYVANHFNDIHVDQTLDYRTHAAPNLPHARSLLVRSPRAQLPDSNFQLPR